MKITETDNPPAERFAWNSDQQVKQPKTDRKTSSPDVTLIAAAACGDTDELSWTAGEDGRLVLTIPASPEARVLSITRCSTTASKREAIERSLLDSSVSIVTDPTQYTHGSDLRWPEVLSEMGQLGEAINGYALDRIPVPFENPWNAWIRTSALDFFEDGRAVVTTHGGDVYLVDGIDDELSEVRWKRFAAGLFEPFGVRVIDKTVYVTCRDGLKRLHDFNDDGEADFIEVFWNDDDVSSMFHAYNFDLQTDSQGNFYFAKAGQYTRHHRPGTIMRIPPQGGHAKVVAWGIRTPNGMGKLFDDRFTVSDNQGPWMPAGKISLIKQDSFLGNMPINDEQTQWLKKRHGGELPTSFDEPMIWMPQELDNSCGGQVWVDDKRFGPLSGRLIHSSFGKGWLYYLSMQEVGDHTQASIVALPHQWDAGVMRLRTNPADGQLYGTGLSGWQGPASGQDGCLQRLRYTGDRVLLIEDVSIVSDGLEIAFNFDLDTGSVGDPSSWRAEMWDYLWSRRYGSDQFSVLHPGQTGRDELSVSKVGIVDDRTIRISIPELATCDQLRLEMDFETAMGHRFIEEVYFTIHEIPSK